MSNTTIIVVAAIFLIALVLLLLIRGRKQRVTFSEARPLPRAAAPAAAPQPVPTPTAPAEAPTPAAPPMSQTEPSEGAGDRLTTIKGLGPKAAALLNSLGVTRFDQIAGWNESDVAAIDAQMGAFKGRIMRDRWVEQAKLLAKGDTAAFEAEFGKLGG